MKKHLLDIQVIKKYLAIQSLCLHIEKGFEDFINKKPEGRQEEKIISLLKRYKESSTSGNPEARNIIKSHIRTGLLSSFDIYKQNEEGKLIDDILFQNIKIEEENGLADLIISFNNADELSDYEKFIIILYANKKIEDKNRDSAFGKLITKYKYYEKSRSTSEYISTRYEYNSKDICRIYNEEKISLTFTDKIEIIVQIIYEKLFGLMCLDVLAYSDVNEVGFSNDGKYVYCWCNIKIWLSFMKLTEDEARAVQDRAISFDKSVGQLDRNNPEKLCHRADGARITVTQPPYFSSRNLCIRIFNKSNASYNDLESCEKMRILTTALIKSGESICLQGSLGTGKTTKMETMFEILDDYLHIGTIEDYFEQHIMQKYHNKRIVEAQAVNNKSLIDAVKTMLRMSVDVADLGEVRDGSALFAFIQLVQSVSIAAWFTTHIVNPETTVPRLKNILMGTGRYLTEQAAVMDIIHYINIIFQHEIIDGKRVISKVVEIVPLVSSSFQLNMELNINSDLEDLKKLYYLQQIQSNPLNMYKLNTIAEYKNGIVSFVNFPSSRMLQKAENNLKSKHYMDRLVEAITLDINSKEG